MWQGLDGQHDVHHFSAILFPFSVSLNVKHLTPPLYQILLSFLARCSSVRRDTCTLDFGHEAVKHLFSISISPMWRPQAIRSTRIGIFAHS